MIGKNKEQFAKAAIVEYANRGGKGLTVFEIKLPSKLKTTKPYSGNGC